MILSVDSILVSDRSHHVINHCAPSRSMFEGRPVSEMCLRGRTVEQTATSEWIYTLLNELGSG